MIDATGSRLNERSAPPRGSEITHERTGTSPQGSTGNLSFVIASGRSLGVLVLLGLLDAACAAGTSERFDVRYAAEFGAGRKTVSVVGVFQDGLMSEEAWTLLGPRLSQALHQSACEVWYGEKLAAAKPEVFAALGKSARDEGITDGLLEGIAPHAEGDHVIVFQMYGRPPRRARRGEADEGILIAHGGGAADSHYLPKRTPTEADAMEVSATLFSVAARHSVAHVVLEYSGSRVDDAIAKFSQKLTTAIPDAICAGWKWHAIPEQ
jgi:hypothetical protein